MAYTNPLKIANGLVLDFAVQAADAADNFLGVNTDGDVTVFTSIASNRVSGGGNLTETTSSVLTITGGTAAVLTSGLTIAVTQAGVGTSGYLSTTDWNTFNNKLSTSLADGTIWIGSGAGVATARTLSGDVTVSNTGVTSIGAGVIVNADINASAAIAFSKMAALTVNLVTATDGSGVITTVTGFTTTIAGYLTNISSDVQSQFTTTNQRIVGLTTNALVQAPTAAEDGYAIVWNNTAAEWQLSASGGGGGSVTGPVSSTDNAITRWNGTDGTSIQDSGVSIDDSNNVTGVATITIGTSGLHLLDTNASHDLIISVGTNLTADRTLTVTTGDADRTLTLSGNPTISDWFDQSVKTTATPLFADVTVSNASGYHILDSDDSHDLILRTTSNLTADRELIFVTGDATRTLTINASGTLYVTGGTDVTVADGGTGLSAISALSILVANVANTYVEVTPGAGNSIRINAGGTAWEAYTPSGSIGGSTGSVDNALLRANGTGGSTVQAASASIDDAGDFFLGTSSLVGTNRVIAPVSSGGVATLQLQDEVGTGVLIIGNEQLNFTNQSGGSIVNIVTSGTNVELLLYGDTNSSIKGLPGSVTTSTGHSGHLTLAGGDGVSDDANGGNLYLRGGVPNGAGVAGGVIVSDDVFYLGGIANDKWRFLISGDDLLIQQRETGTYVTKSTISGA